MRSVAYVVAALAAVGIMIALVMMPVSETTAPGDAVPAEAAAEVAAQEADVKAVAGETETLVLHVPEMHCPFACYPAVKQTLEGDASVAGVELAEQKQEGVIDNPRVVVTVSDGFDADAAIAALAKKGFKNSEVVQ